MMLGLRVRDLLPCATLDELESLIARLKAFLLEEHNEDGTHTVDEWADDQPGSC